MKVLRWIGWGIVWLAAIFFTLNGIQKIMGADQMVTMFHELGLADWIRVAVGCIELIGAILLVIPRYTLLAAAGLLSVMIGAVVIEHVHERTFSAMLAGQWLIVFAVIGVVRYKLQLKRRSGAMVTDH